MKPLCYFLGAVLLLTGATGCKRAPSYLLQGYAEGEFVYVSSPLPGRLTKLSVQRGRQVGKGDELFALESVAETAVRDEAEHRLAQAQATLEDAKKGRRPTEIESLNAQLKQAQEAMSFSLSEQVRQEMLRKTGAVAVESIDKARSMFMQDKERVAQLEADIKTAELGMRSDAVSALEFEVKARSEALAKAEWDLAQKQQKAPQAGAVYDTLYREGEFVAAGRPVVSLLPPANMKVRVFVPEDRLATLHPGDAAQVHVDGLAEAITGKVSFISPQAEYTPPVIYSQENRSKLVFMVELRFDDADAVKLHPGQPVDVEFPR
ncbi:MAG TPA: HlyD family efflux transporter periplasmic adaptor subunit [Prosthecobacter sp.]|nr:HlyD family efflux transporter periplasmic adaptor subunit [Prosthecobacter sp.]